MPCEHRDLDRLAFAVAIRIIPERAGRSVIDEPIVGIVGNVDALSCES